MYKLFASGVFSLIILCAGNMAIGPLPPLGPFFSPFHGFSKNAEPIGHYKNIVIDIPGLNGGVEVVLDDRLVPHIYASNLSDAYRVQGYLHAKYRLWQMDLTHRSTLGRLSEVLGPRTIEYDKKQRRIGLPRAAKNAFSHWQDDAKVMDLMKAYADGVNAYIDQLKAKDYPIEFKLMNYKPEKYTPFNAAVLAISMANVLCSYNQDVELTNTKYLIPEEDFEDLFPVYNPNQDPVIPSERTWDFDPDVAHKESGDDALGLFYEPGYHPYDPVLGSNNWVVGPNKSASGYPILCNDPHLNLTLPSIWYENHLHTPDVHVYGVSLPGAPGVIIGFNENIAWGQTNVGQDILDWYEIKWTDSKKDAYILDGEEKYPESVIEKIEVKGHSVVLDTVKWTTWGPVWTKGKKNLAAKWVIHNDLNSNLFMTFIELNQASDYAGYKNALRNFDAPAQNFAFAAKDGDIAIHPQGKFPIRHQGGGRVIKDGSKSSEDWQGFIPFEQQPSIYNPSQGYVASANQHTTDETYPYFYHGGFDDYRGRILNRYLRRDSSITIEDCKSFQLSNLSILAEEMTPLLLAHIDKNKVDENGRRVLKELADWDYTFNKNSKAGTLFSFFRDGLIGKVWDEFDAQPTLPRIKPETWKLVEMMRDTPDHPYFDIVTTDQRENLTDLINLTFDEMVSTYPSMGDIQEWKEYKGTTIGHLARIPAFSKEVATGGFKQSLNAQSKSHGPSWRMIVEMGETVKALGVYPGGQSGNPGSEHYADMLPKWSNGEYYELQFVADPDRIDNSLFSLHFK